MLVLKNTFGKTAVIDPRICSTEKIGEFGGSSLTRKKYPKKEKNPIQCELDTPLLQQGEAKNKKKLRSMSLRSKAKIRRKIIAFAGQERKLTFVTLTFTNEVDDTLAVKILHSFLDNVGKRSKDFEYIWVAEKQTKNEVFKNNIHFHLITNKYWKIEKWLNYWLEIQAKYNIVPREEGFKASSGFDVKAVNSNNIKGIVNYLTKYVTKNEGKFECQVWNCSKGISRLYTDFYSSIGFLRQLERLEKSGQLGGEIKTYAKEYCNIHLIPLNRTTMPFYRCIDEKNKETWNNEKSKKEVNNEIGN